ncbi:MAG: sigma-70 family RNA polymerase sigma factor [Anaerolineae bacterium]|nr:sigma-70 family RNA polymerase sigma factor [Anaerolineae bacterium]
MLTVMITKDELRKQILERARDQGGITYDDILSVVPNAEGDLTLVEDIMDDLLDAGVEVTMYQAINLPAPHDLDAQTANETEWLADEEAEYAAFIDNDLIDDAGYQQALDSDDVVGLYLKEAGRVPLLTAAEEVSLAKRMERAALAQTELDTLDAELPRKERTDRAFIAQQQLDELGHQLPRDDVYTLQEWAEEGDRIDDLERLVGDGELAQEHLVRANARLVISVAKKYIGRGVPFLDLIQEGNIGLMRATNKFDYLRGHKFSTYATWWIRQAVSRAVADQGRTIRVPVHMGDQLNRMRRIQLQLTQELGRDPLIDELAVGMETTPDKIENLLEIARRPVSLETPIDEDGDSTFGDFVEDVNSPAPAEEVATNLLHEQLKTALDRLPTREAQILRLRYGLEDGRVYTLEEVGQAIGVTRERVRQLEAQALNRLRQSSAHVILRDYLYD